jgi:hypothetical protein
MHESIFYLLLSSDCEESNTGLQQLDDSPPAIQTQKVTIILVISVHTSCNKERSASYNLNMFLPD